MRKGRQNRSDVSFIGWRKINSQITVSVMCERISYDATKRWNWFLFFIIIWNFCRSASSKGRRGEQRSRSSSPETGVGSGTKGSSATKGRPFAKPISRALNMSVTQKVVGCLRSNVLTILNIAGVFSGVVLALALRSSREEKWTQREIVYVGFVGKSHDLEPVITGWRFVYWARTFSNPVSCL